MEFLEPPWDGMGWDVEDWNDSMIPLHVWRFLSGISKLVLIHSSLTSTMYP
jgi:hypothetical protein